jgi:hypothetical protein
LTASAKLTWFLTRENLRNPKPLQANIGSPKQMFLVKKGNEVRLFLKIKLQFAFSCSKMIYAATNLFCSWKKKIKTQLLISPIHEGAHERQPGYCGEICTILLAGYNSHKPVLKNFVLLYSISFL